MNLRDKLICLAAAIVIPVSIPMMIDSTPPCPEEDSQGPCYWDASTRGNGEGNSFFVTLENEVIYL